MILDFSSITDTLRNFLVRFFMFQMSIQYSDTFSKYGYINTSRLKQLIIKTLGHQKHGGMRGSLDLSPWDDNKVNSYSPREDFQPNTWTLLRDMHIRESEVGKLGHQFHRSVLHFATSANAWQSFHLWKDTNNWSTSSYSSFIHYL